MAHKKVSVELMLGIHNSIKWFLLQYKSLFLSLQGPAQTDASLFCSYIDQKPKVKSQKQRRITS